MMCDGSSTRTTSPQPKLCCVTSSAHGKSQLSHRACTAPEHRPLAEEQGKEMMSPKINPLSQTPEDIRRLCLLW